MEQQTTVILSIMIAGEFKTTTTRHEQVFSNKMLALDFIKNQENDAQKLVEINPKQKVILIIHWKMTDPDGFFVTGEKSAVFKGKEFKRD